MMVPGAIAATRAVTGLNPEDVNRAVEFIIVLEGELFFYTGGYESIESLEVSITQNYSIEGNFDPGDVPWIKASLQPRHIVAIIDIREDQNGDESEEGTEVEVQSAPYKKEEE